MSRWNYAYGWISRGSNWSRASGVVSRGVDSPAGERDQHFFRSFFSLSLSIRGLPFPEQRKAGFHATAT